MKKRCVFFIIFAELAISNMATAGIIRFTGAISEPACVTDVTAQRTQVLCSRAASIRTMNLGSASTTRALPWDLAVVRQNTTGQRRDIVITYR